MSTISVLGADDSPVARREASAQDLRTRASNSGARFLIAKPVTAEAFPEALQAVLAR